jgi:glc operon protein GlcG
MSRKSKAGYKEEKNMLRKNLVKVFVLLLIAVGALETAVAQMPNPYGLPISLENAKKAAAPAMAEAAKNNWTMAVAIVGPAGNLIYYEKMDNTQLGSAEVAIEKARTAALFKRPTKALQDAVAAGGEGLRVLALKGAVPIEGGIPLVMDGKIVGAIGVSGGTSAQDGQCAKAGADTIK